MNERRWAVGALLCTQLCTLALPGFAQDEAPDELSADPPASAAPPAPVRDPSDDPADGAGATTDVKEPKRALTSREIADRVLPSVVTVVVELDDESQSLGSGFFIDEDLIVTNYHVVEYGIYADYKLAGQKRLYEIRGVVAVDEEADLVVLRTRDKIGKPVGLAGPMPSLGDRIYAVGSPEGLEATFSDGVVSGLRGEDRELLQITAAVSRGSSGGPVVNEYGEVVGVVAAKARRGESLNFAISSRKIDRLLKDRQELVPLDELEDYLYETEREKRMAPTRGRGSYDDGGRRRRASSSSSDDLLYLLGCLFIAPPVAALAVFGLAVSAVCAMYCCVFATLFLRTGPLIGITLLGTGGLLAVMAAVVGGAALVANAPLHDPLMAASSPAVWAGGAAAAGAVALGATVAATGAVLTTAYLLRDEEEEGPAGAEGAEGAPELAPRLSDQATLAAPSSY